MYAYDVLAHNAKPCYKLSTQTWREIFNFISKRNIYQSVQTADVVLLAD